MKRSSTGWALCVVGAILSGAVGWRAQAAGTQGTALTSRTPRRGGNPEAAKLQNPVPSTPESIAAGQRTFKLLCTRCHGIEGRGDGGGAGAGGQPADFTDAVWEFGGSDGEIFMAIHDGTSADMESYAERLSQTEIWHLVNYLRTLQKRESPPA
jgi:mono/diheme cytochrome c family protein